jgi:hypothetical protein
MKILNIILCVIFLPFRLFYTAIEKHRKIAIVGNRILSGI